MLDTVLVTRMKDYNRAINSKVVTDLWGNRHMNNLNAGLWGHQQGGRGILRKECFVGKCVNVQRMPMEGVRLGPVIEDE